MKKKNLETICIHGGWKPKKGESQQLPIFQSTTFRYETSDQMARLFDLKDNGYFYTRLANPTNDAVAQKIAALEGGVGAVLTSSGQAANFYAIFNICQAGDHFITAIGFHQTDVICHGAGILVHAENAGMQQNDQGNRRNDPTKPLNGIPFKNDHQHDGGNTHCDQYQ